MTTIEEICNLALSHVGDWKIASIDEATPAGRKCKQWYSQTLKEALRACRWNFALARALLVQDVKTITAAVEVSGFTEYTSTSHGFSVGDFVRVDGLLGFPVENPQRVTAVSTNLITTDWPWQGGAYVSGGTVAKCPSHGYGYQFAKPSDCLRVLSVNGEFKEAASPWIVEGGVILSDDSTLAVRYTAAVSDVQMFDPLFVEVLALKLGANLAKPLTGSGSRETELLQRLKTDTLPRALRADAIEAKALQAQDWQGDFVQARKGGI